MGGLKAITETCQPRDDVLGGRLSDQMFAANLDTIVRDRASYPVYGDPEEFFALTHPTNGMRRLLTQTFGRLSGADVAGVEHGVIRLQTSFGGGKTHGLIVTYYLAGGVRPANVEQFVDPALLPASCQVAAVVADLLDPATGAVFDGERTRTLWGAIAAQLHRFDDMRVNDEERSAPGSEQWDAVIGSEPTLIIIDEIAGYLRKLTSSGNEDARRMAASIPVFLKNLFDYAAEHRNVAVILTLATRSDTFGKETSEIEDLLSEAEEAFQSTLGDTASTVARPKSPIIRPAEDSEIAQILKTRLFARIDPAAAQAAAESYRSFYEDLAAKGQGLDGGADRPTAYAELIESSYPFHPELVRVLDKRLGTIPNFQRTRGALKLLAEVVAGLWAQGPATEMLNVADIGLSLDPVLTDLTAGLGRDEYEQVARVDICGPASHAASVDTERFGGRPYATRSATTVFLHSLEQAATSGAAPGALLLGTLEVGDDPAVVEEALAALADRAWHLDYDGSRYRFLTEPNANAIVAEEARNIPNSQVSAELAERVTAAFGDDGPVKSRVHPSGPVDVPNEARLQLVVVHHDDATVTARTALPPPERVVDIRDHAGAANGIRTYRNGVVFLVADADQVQGMRDRLRWVMATERICSSSDRLAQFAEPVRKKLESLADDAGLQMMVAIARCYSHLYYPFADRHNANLRHYELPAKDKGQLPKKLTKTVPDALRDEGKIRDAKFPTDYLKAKAWPKDAVDVTAAALAQHFWLDHSANIVVDPNVLKESIRDGVRNGAWVYYDADQGKLWTASDPPPPAALEATSILYIPVRAEELGLLRRPLRIDDVTAVLQRSLTGPELREALEAATGHEPQKGEIAAVLSRAVQGGPAAKVVVVIGPPHEDTKAATPSQVEKAGFDTITVLTPVEAEAQGIDTGMATKVRPVEGRGVAGVAMSQVVERAGDVNGSEGIVALHITTSADPGEGIRDIRSLGAVIPRLAKLDIDVQVDLGFQFAGLDHGVTVTLNGSSSAYLGIEDQLLALGKAASQVAGTMALVLRTDQPLLPDSPQLEQVRKALVDLDPGELVIRADLA